MVTLGHVLVKHERYVAGRKGRVTVEVGKKKTVEVQFTRAFLAL